MMMERQFLFKIKRLIWGGGRWGECFVAVEVEQGMQMEWWDRGKGG